MKISKKEQANKLIKQLEEEDNITFVVDYNEIENKEDLRNTDPVLPEKYKIVAHDVNILKIGGIELQDKINKLVELGVGGIVSFLGGQSVNATKSNALGNGSTDSNNTLPTESQLNVVDAKVELLKDVVESGGTDIATFKLDGTITITDTPTQIVPIINVNYNNTDGRISYSLGVWDIKRDGNGIWKFTQNIKQNVSTSGKIIYELREDDGSPEGLIVDTFDNAFDFGAIQTDTDRTGSIELSAKNSVDDQILERKYTITAKTDTVGTTVDIENGAGTQSITFLAGSGTIAQNTDGIIDLSVINTGGILTDTLNLIESNKLNLVNDGTSQKTVIVDESYGNLNFEMYDSDGITELGKLGLKDGYVELSEIGLTDPKIPVNDNHATPKIYVDDTINLKLLNDITSSAICDFNTNLNESINNFKKLIIHTTTWQGNIFDTRSYNVEDIVNDAVYMLHLNGYTIQFVSDTNVNFSSCTLNGIDVKIFGVGRIT